MFCECARIRINQGLLIGNGDFNFGFVCTLYPAGQLLCRPGDRQSEEAEAKKSMRRATEGLAVSYHLKPRLESEWGIPLYLTFGWYEHVGMVLRVPPVVVTSC